MTKPLNDEQLAEIAWASGGETTRRLAQRLGVTVDAVRFSRKRLRAEGFTCRLYWTICRWCGEALAARRHDQEVHDRCRDADTQAYHARYRARDDVKAARKAFIAANPDRNRASQVRLTEAMAQAQERTKASEWRNGARWTPGEDALVLNADRRDKQEAVALALGRSYSSVLSRRRRLNKIGSMPKAN